MTILSQGSEIVADVLDPLVDSFMEPLIDTFKDSEILKEIPAIGVVVKIGMLGKSIADRISLTKIKRFLTALDPATIDEAREFGAKLAAGDIEAKHTVEILILAIDAMNDLAKAPMIAAVFTEFLKGEINHADFRRITAAINLAIVDDLSQLASLGPDPAGPSKPHEALVDSLHHTGLTGATSDYLLLESNVDLATAILPLGKVFAAALKAAATRRLV